LTYFLTTWNLWFTFIMWHRICAHFDCAIYWDKQQFIEISNIFIMFAHFIYWDKQHFYNVCTLYFCDLHKNRTIKCRTNFI
jgi:hypothetical protein